MIIDVMFCFKGYLSAKKGAGIGKRSKRGKRRK